MPQPLQPATFDVPIRPLDQHSTKTGGPVGRLKKLVNAVVKKISQEGNLRIEKRDGFAVLPSAVRDPATGATSAKSLSTSQATLLTTYGAQLIAVFLAAPFVLSEAAGCWESPTYNAPTQVLRSKPVFSGSVGPATTPIQSIPDEARIGTRTMYTWATGTGGTVLAAAMLIDDDGTIIRQPFFPGNVGRVRVVADGTQFWIVWDNGGTGFIQAQAYDVNGAFLNVGLLASAGTNYFDVTKNTNAANSIVLTQMQPAGTGAVIATITWNGSTVTTATTGGIGLAAGTGRVTFLANERNDHRYYLVATDNFGGPIVTRVAQVSDSSLTVTSGPNTVATTGTAPAESAGFVSPTGNADTTIVLSFLDATPTPQLNFTQIYTVTFAGAATLVRTQKSLTLASRAFRMQAGGDYYAVGYYHSNPAGVTGIAQSTYFLMDLGTSYQVAGRWEAGTAYGDWLVTTNTAQFGYLSTPQVDPNGGVHIALAYRASSTIAVTTTGDAFIPTKTLVDVVGIKDYQFGPDGGQAVEHSGALLLPGPEAVNYTGATFAEDGLGLIPEVISVTNGGAGALTGTYEWVVVDEWTDNNGQRVRSPAGKGFTLTGSSFQATITGYHNHVTRKTNLIHSIYRTYVDATGVMTTTHNKVSGSLQGGTYLGSVVVNDDTANTWTFTDNMIDSTAANNEELYTDKGFLDRYPAPPFRTGLATFDRIFLAGYDGAIWFSGQKTEGDAFWFHPTFRIPLPTRQEVTAIKLLDDSIVVLCDGDTVFQIPNGPWPDATGGGSLPTPRVLPFSNGCPDGTAETISDGIIYSAQQGGIWLITRDFRNVYIGSPVEDEKNPDETFVGVATDDKQRTVFVTSGTNILVYDQVTGVWGTWAVNAPALITSHKGRIVLGAQNGPPWRQVIGQYFDSANSAIFTLARIRVAPGGIRRFMRTWQAQMVGDWLGDHDMTVTASIDDISGGGPTASQSWTPTAGALYVYELPANAATELSAAIDYEFADSFPRGASQGFALEAMSLYVGLGDRLKGLPAASRIGST